MSQEFFESFLSFRSFNFLSKCHQYERLCYWIVFVEVAFPEKTAKGNSIFRNPQNLFTLHGKLCWVSYNFMELSRSSTFFHWTWLEGTRFFMHFRPEKKWAQVSMQKLFHLQSWHPRDTSVLEGNLQGCRERGAAVTPPPAKPGKFIVLTSGFWDSSRAPAPKFFERPQFFSRTAKLFEKPPNFFENLKIFPKILNFFQEIRIFFSKNSTQFLVNNAQFWNTPKNRSTCGGQRV